MLSRHLKGSNLTNVRDVNERLILHLLRMNGRMSKAEATRMTGLSANAVSVIFRALEADGLLLRGEPIRGRIGQPSVPMWLNPSAAHYVGLKIGRRSQDIVLVNFAGDVLVEVNEFHDYPTPANTLAFVQTQLPNLLKKAELNEEDISAFNVAMPFELWSWASVFGVPPTALEDWRQFDLAAELKRIQPWPVTIQNDGTAACRAELVFGPPPEVQDLVYFFVGTFIGGGIVLNGSVFPGRSGNAGGFGPMRIPDEPGGERLVDHASLRVLELLIAERDPELAKTVYNNRDDWSIYEPELDIWLERAGRSLGHAIVSALAVMDFQAIIIDGAFPPGIRQRLVEIVDRDLDNLDMQGVMRPSVQPGHFGYLARAVGAAAYQVSTEYMIDQNTLLRESPSTVLPT